MNAKILVTVFLLLFSITASAAPLWEIWDVVITNGMGEEIEREDGRLSELSIGIGPGSNYYAFDLSDPNDREINMQYTVKNVGDAPIENYQPVNTGFSSVRTEAIWNPSTTVYPRTSEYKEIFGLEGFVSSVSPVDIDVGREVRVQFTIAIPEKLPNYPDYGFGVSTFNKIIIAQNAEQGSGNPAGGFGLYFNLLENPAKAEIIIPTMRLDPEVPGTLDNFDVYMDLENPGPNNATTRIKELGINAGLNCSTDNTSSLLGQNIFVASGATSTQTVATNCTISDTLFTAGFWTKISNADMTYDILEYVTDYIKDGGTGPVTFNDLTVNSYYVDNDFILNDGETGLRVYATIREYRLPITDPGSLHVKEARITIKDLGTAGEPIIYEDTTLINHTFTVLAGQSISDTLDFVSPEITWSGAFPVIIENMEVKIEFLDASGAPIHIFTGGFSETLTLDTLDNFSCSLESGSPDCICSGPVTVSSTKVRYSCQLNSPENRDVLINFTNLDNVPTYNIYQGISTSPSGSIVSGTSSESPPRQLQVMANPFGKVFDIIMGKNVPTGVNTYFFVNAYIEEGAPYNGSMTITINGVTRTIAVSNGVVNDQRIGPFLLVPGQNYTATINAGSFSKTITIQT